MAGLKIIVVVSADVAFTRLIAVLRDASNPSMPQMMSTLSLCARSVVEDLIIDFIRLSSGNLHGCRQGKRNATYYHGDMNVNNFMTATASGMSSARFRINVHDSFHALNS